MSTIIESFNKIKLNISKVSNADSVKIVAVSKTFSLDHIMPLIDHGHTHYGENKVQEADIKWTNIRKERTNLKLHLIEKKTEAIFATPPHPHNNACPDKHL
jgi:uncharacterized pyridoxal phosphate-containing UPF0001 family protein